MHLNFLDTSPLKVFASCTRGMLAVCAANILNAVPTKAMKGVSGYQACNADPCRLCMPGHLDLRIPKESCDG